MYTEKRQSQPLGNRVLWIMLLMGLILTGIGIFVPQQTGTIDIRQVEKLIGVLLAVSAFISVLLV